MNRETLINTAAVIAAFVVQLFISFWLSPLVVAKLGEEAYGFINLANSFVSYASLISVAINSMACRFISVEYNSGKVDEAKKYFSTVVIANSFLLGVVLIVAIVLISNIQLVVNVSPALVFQVKCTFLLSFINMGVSLIGTAYTSAAFSTYKMHYTSLVQVVANVIKSVAVYLLFVLLPAKIYYLSAATLLAGIVTLAGNYRVTKLLFGDFTVKLHLFDLDKVLILIKSGFWVLLSNISNMLLSGLDLLLSNWFIGAALMGRLSLAKQIPYAFSSALGIFSSIFSSSLTKSFAQNGRGELTNEVKSQLALLSFIFTTPYSIIIALGIPFLALWLQGSHYSLFDINEIYFLMILTLIDIVVSTYMYSIHSVFIALNQVKRYSIVLLIASIISIATTVLLLEITPYGLYVIAGTSTVVLGLTHAIIVPAMAARMLREKISVFWKVELKSWIVLLVFSALLFVLRFSMSLNSLNDLLIACIVIALIGYSISFFLFFSKMERKRLGASIIKIFAGK